MSHAQDIAIGEVRDFWNRRPCNIRHSTKGIGSREYFDEVEARKYLVERHIPGFAEFERWKGKRVLEIGCGIGTDTMNFARAGADVTAVDLSEKSLEIARQRAAVFGLSNIQFYHGNAEELTSFVPGRGYDLIYSFGVIHHTPHPERVIRAAPALQPPGHCLEDHGLSPQFLEGIADSAARGAWRFLEIFRADRAPFRGANRLAGNLLLHAAQRARFAQRFCSRLGRHRPHLPLSHPGLPAVPLRETVVLPLFAGAAVSMARKAFWLASLH